MKYRKEFLEEYRQLKKHGMPEELIEDYYTSVAREVIRSNDRYIRHNKCLYSNSKGDFNPDIFYYQSGSLRKQDKAGEESAEVEKSIEDLEKEDQCRNQQGAIEDDSEKTENTTDWATIKIIAVSLATEDNTDIYVEHVEITEQLGDAELQKAIWSLSERQQEILELILDGWRQNRIAERLGISGAAVCKHVKIIEKVLEPYYRKTRWLKITSDSL